MPMIVAPIAGAMSDRIGGRPMVATGLALQAIALAWLAAVLVADGGLQRDRDSVHAGRRRHGALLRADGAVVLGSVGRSHAGQASGANNAIRELGGVFGVAVLASIFTHEGGYGSAQMFTDGIIPALWVGAIAVGVGALIATLIPGKGSRSGPQPSRRRSPRRSERTVGHTRRPRSRDGARPVIV